MAQKKERPTPEPPPPADRRA